MKTKFWFYDSHGHLLSNIEKFEVAGDQLTYYQRLEDRVRVYSSPLPDVELTTAETLTEKNIKIVKFILDHSVFVREEKNV